MVLLTIFCDHICSAHHKTLKLLPHYALQLLLVASYCSLRFGLTAQAQHDMPHTTYHLPDVHSHKIKSRSSHFCFHSPGTDVWCTHSGYWSREQRITAAAAEQPHGHQNEASPFTLATLTTRQQSTSCRAHPAEMPHLQHAEEDSVTSGDPPADHILLPLAETGDGSSICQTDRTVCPRDHWWQGRTRRSCSCWGGTCTSPATWRAVVSVPIQQHKEQWNLYQSSNTKSSGTCASLATQRAVEPVPVQQHGESVSFTSPATRTAVEPVPVQQHEELWNLYQSSNMKSSGTCTSPATQRAVEPVPVQQHEEQWNVYQSSNTKSSRTCTNPATQRAVEPVPVQQHKEQWNLYQSSNTKSSGTCTSPATWREWNLYQSSNTKNRRQSNLVCHLCHQIHFAFKDNISLTWIMYPRPLKCAIVLAYTHNEQSCKFNLWPRETNVFMKMYTCVPVTLLLLWPWS